MDHYLLDECDIILDSPLRSLLWNVPELLWRGPKNVITQWNREINRAVQKPRLPPPGKAVKDVLYVKVRAKQSRYGVTNGALRRTSHLERGVC